MCHFYKVLKMKKAFTNSILELCFLSLFKMSLTQTDNSFYLNPILGGNYSDPSVVNVSSYYDITHSSFNYLAFYRFIWLWRR